MIIYLLIVIHVQKKTHLNESMASKYYSLKSASVEPKPYLSESQYIVKSKTLADKIRPFSLKDHIIDFLVFFP